MQARIAMKVLPILGLALMSAGCSSHVVLTYPPEDGTYRSDGCDRNGKHLYLLRFADSRPQKYLVGRSDMSDVVTRDNVAEWIRRAVTEELQRAGYEVHAGSPSSVRTGDLVLHGDVLKVYGTGGFKCDAEVRFAAGMQRDGEVILDDTQYAGAASVRSSRFGVRRGFAESLPLALGEAIDTFVSDVNNVLMLEDAATAREDVHEVAVVEKTDTRPPPRVGAAPPAMRWAIVIGVSDYADTRIPALRYASADAKSFSDWLIDPKGGGFAPSRVKKLLDGDATYENIREALFEWGAHALAEDLMVIYFACHGTGESPDDLDSVYLLPSDAKFDKIASSGFPMWDVETAIKHHIKARRVVVIADACHSGGIGREYDIGRRGIEIRPKVADSVGNLGSASESVAVIMASGVGQLSQESKEWGGGHGVFTHYLLEGLKGKADANKDGKVSLGELTPYLSQQVRRATKSRQCPVVAGEYDPTLMIAK